MPKTWLKGLVLVLALSACGIDLVDQPVVDLGSPSIEEARNAPT